MGQYEIFITNTNFPKNKKMQLIIDAEETPSTFFFHSGMLMTKNEGRRKRLQEMKKVEIKDKKFKFISPSGHNLLQNIVKKIIFNASIATSC